MLTDSQSGLQKSTSEAYDYDSFGNVISFIDSADDGSADDVFGTIGYHQAPASHIIKSPWRGDGDDRTASSFP